ncbi:MAG: hypothetical protein EOM11_10730 [Erysipelotrichia bacterium]|nr:hypothetical protein [Erysipelotrichia bacterium]
MEKRIKYKLIVNGIVLTKQDEATIDKLIEQHSLEQVERAIDKLIINKKPISELKIDESETIGDKNIGLAKDIAEAIVIFSCVRKITLDDDYWKTNPFSDTTDDEYKLGIDYLKQNRKEMLELYETYIK